MDFLLKRLLLPLLPAHPFVGPTAGPGTSSYSGSSWSFGFIVPFLSRVAMPWFHRGVSGVVVVSSGSVPFRLLVPPMIDGTTPPLGVGSSVAGRPVSWVLSLSSVLPVVDRTTPPLGVRSSVAV